MQTRHAPPNSGAPMFAGSELGGGHVASRAASSGWVGGKRNLTVRATAGTCCISDISSLGTRNSECPQCHARAGDPVPTDSLPRGEVGPEVP
eukprot:9214655-Alexandrium_andersonii.AAC.1